MAAVFEDIFAEFDNTYIPISCHSATEIYHSDIMTGEPYISAPHWHDYIEIIYTVSGGCIVNIGGLVSEINEGDLFIINSKEAHSIKSYGNGDFLQIVLKFDPQILYIFGDNAVEYKYVYPFLLSKTEYRRIFTKAEVINSDISDTMRSLLKDFTDKPYAYEMAMHMKCLSVFLWFLYQWRKEDMLIFDGNKINSIKKFGGLFIYIAKHMNENITTKSAAEQCHMSYGYFCRAFKNVMGKTFIEYLNFIRISKSQHLLLTSAMNITEIGFNVGFSDLNYFIRKFKEVTRYSPSNFRKSFLSKNEST